MTAAKILLWRNAVALLGHPTPRYNGRIEYVSHLRAREINSLSEGNAYYEKMGKRTHGAKLARQA